jgi:hypothetical protein
LASVIDDVSPDALPTHWFQTTSNTNYPLIWNIKYRSVTVFYPEPHYITVLGDPINSIVIPLD